MQQTMAAGEVSWVDCELQDTATDQEVMRIVVILDEDGENIVAMLKEQ